MGQEASLPQANGDEFEEQARAPPSSVNPPPPTQPGRPGSKMIGAMLHRAAQNSNQQHQIFEGKESARAAAGSGQMPFVSGSSGGEQYGNGQQMMMQQQQYPPPNLQQMSPEEQQQYYQQQQMLMMQQQQQQQLLQQQQSQHQYYDPRQQPPPHGDTNVNVNMYGPAGKKSGRGKALINSMRNLSIGNTIRSGVQGAAHAAAATANAAVATATSATAAAKLPKRGGIQDWETRWDEDDSDEDEEGDEEVDTGAQAATAAAAMHHHQQQHHQQSQSPMRPGMDTGHPGMSSRGAEISTMASPPRKNMVAPIQEPAVQGVDDGLEWDTGVQQGVTQKPNVQMFLPLLRVLGKGSFGKVVLVQKRVGKERGSMFAMKILKKTHLVKRRQIERTRTERKVLSAVNHPFIMKLHYAFQNPEKLYLVLDYCPGGELFFHLSRFRRFPERVARFYAAELLLAIGHLHKRGIIYRDLKPENVLLDADGHVKLGDFGLAKAGIKHPCEGAVSMCGTPEYMAPELINQQGHGFCVDYWGLGMLVYEMMTGLPPWYTTDRSKLFRRLKSAPLEIPNYFSPQAASCVSALLERNPRRRLGVAGVRTAMEHDFFRSINWRALYGRRVEAPIRPCEGWKPPEAVREELMCMENGNGSRDPATMPTSSSDNMNVGDLDAATANFDNTFTRMPVNTEEGAEQADDSEAAEELNEDTFIGFSFDDKDREALQSGRQRTQVYHQPQSQEPPPHTHHQLD